MFRNIGIILICTTLFYSPCLSQEIEVEGGFIQENIKIGESVQYWLKARYPSRLEVLFPGEDYDYKPYEFVEKEYFPSTYDSAFVTDSAVYTLTSFEIDPWQSLRLPVFIINEGDSVPIATYADSLQFIEIAPVFQPGDTVTLKTDTSFLDVPLQFNYPYLLIGLGIAVVILVVVALVFGKKIINNYRIKKLNKGYEKFSQYYDELIYLTNKSGKKEHLENALTYWKGYLEKLEKVPYTKLTTRELMAVKKDERLIENLKIIDRSLYGHRQSEDIIKRLKSIKSLAKEYQENKIAAIKNG